MQVKAMTIPDQLLNTISDPTIAYLLISAGLLAIFFELASPGAIVPGVSGVIALFLGLVSLGNLDANWAGLLLMALGFVLFAIDLHAPSHGILTTGGVVSFGVGSFLLERTSESPTAGISRVAVVVVTAVMAAFFIFAIGAVLRTRLERVTTGTEGMRGAIGVVREPLDPTGYVFVNGELWRAHSSGGTILIGDFVRVIEVDGLTLLVTPEVGEAHDPERRIESTAA
jgi:membrane-bound serine protease (ClpP class)